MNVPVETVAGHRVLFAMAAEAEYGPHLKRLFAPLMTGVGPVEAGVATAAALAEQEAGEGLPDLVVCLGSAGSRTLGQAEIYQAVSVAYRDMDATALGFPAGVTPFLDLPAVLDLPLRVPGLPEATLASGASIVSGAGYDATGADMVDMETYAVKRAAMRFGVPLIGLRGISDGAAELRHIGDWTDYLHVIDEKLAGAVETLATALASGAVRVDRNR